MSEKILCTIESSDFGFFEKMENDDHIMAVDFKSKTHYICQFTFFALFRLHLASKFAKFEKCLPKQGYNRCD